jgi:hypothetical protein
MITIIRLTPQGQFVDIAVPDINFWLARPLGIEVLREHPTLGPGPTARNLA